MNEANPCLPVPLNQFETSVIRSESHKLMMAIASSCCLNLSPPTSASTISASTSSTAKTNQITWRKRCVLGMACMMMVGDVEMGDSVTGGADHQNLAIAKDDQMQLVVEYYSNDQKKTAGSRWSDKRICPSWHQNSLETIVPENLPRPSARRRWEQVGLTSGNAPAVKLIVRTSNSTCFSM